MALPIGAVAPDFEAETTEGKIKFHDWIGSSVHRHSGLWLPVLAISR
jgi:alkyl hydroperoxide reductase subunit AhpC